MDDELDQQLKELALQAKQLELTSLKRKQILSKLISLIYYSDELRKCKNRHLPDKRDILEDALHNSFLKLNESLNNYKIRGNSKFMNWFSTIFENHINMIHRKQKKDDEKKAPSTTTNSDGKTIEKEIEYIPPDNSIPPSQKIREIIQVDPEGLLQETLSTKYDGVTIQKVLLLRIKGKSAREIALEFGVKTENPAQTAYRWYHEKNKHKKAEINQYIDKYFEDWEEIRKQYFPEEE